MLKICLTLLFAPISIFASKLETFVHLKLSLSGGYRTVLAVDALDERFDRATWLPKWKRWTATGVGPGGSNTVWWQRSGRWPCCSISACSRVKNRHALCVCLFICLSICPSICLLANRRGDVEAAHL